MSVCKSGREPSEEIGGISVARSTSMQQRNDYQWAKD
jgi:hypothetical protein